MIGATIVIFILSILLVSSVGVDFSYDSVTGALELRARVLGIKVQILGGDKKPRKRKPRAKPKKPKQKKPKAEKKPPEIKEKTDWEFIRLIVRSGLDALGKLRRKLAIDLLVLHFTAASEDAAKAALMYGRANAVLGAVFPVMDTALRIRDRDIETAVDFTATAPVVYFRIAAELQIWEIFYIGGSFGIEFLNYKYKNR